MTKFPSLTAHRCQKWQILLIPVMKLPSKLQHFCFSVWNWRDTTASAICTFLNDNFVHYHDVIMGAMASHITSLTVVHSGANQRKHQSSVSLAFVRGIRRWPVNSPAQRASNAENVSIWWRYNGNIFRVSNCWWVITCPSKCLLLPARNLSPETIMTKPTIFNSSVRHGNYQIMAFSLRYVHMCLIVNQVLLVFDRGLAPRTQQTDIKNKQWRSSVTRTYLHYLLIEAKTKRPPFVGDIFNYILLNKTISDRISDIISLKYAL